MEKLNEILNSYCAKGEKTTKDELLGAAFVVVNKDGDSALPIIANKGNSLTITLLSQVLFTRVQRDE